MSYTDEFCSLMREYTVFLEESAQKEKDKLSALLSDDLTKIEQVITSEQTLEKQINGYEKNRLALLEKMGCPQKTFREVLLTLPDGEQAEMNKVFARMQKATDTIKYYNEKSLEYVKGNLKKFHLMEQSAGSEAGYSPENCHPDGWDDKNLFTKKV